MAPNPKISEGKGAVPSAHCSNDLAVVRPLNVIKAVHKIAFTNHLDLKEVGAQLHFGNSITTAVIYSYFASCNLANFDKEPTTNTHFPRS